MKFTANYMSVKMQYAGTSWEELKWIRQAVGFLVRTNDRII